MDTFFGALEFLRDNPGLIWEKLLQHLQLSAAAIGVALLIAIPMASASATCTGGRSSRSTRPTSGGRSRASP